MWISKKLEVHIINFFRDHSHLCLLCAGLLFTVLCYFQGVSGSFLFDDYANLKSLQLVKDIPSAFAYVLDGSSGPTGRPISLLSFVPFASSFPDNPRIFLIGNVAVHLLNGLLVYLCLNKVLAYRGEGNSALLAATLAVVWLTLSSHVSTVNYVVQRMTLLAALFSLMSLFFYVEAFCRLKKHQKSALVYFVCSAFCVILSVESKENGALTVIFLLLVTALLPLKNKGILYWAVVCTLTVVALYVIYYVLSRVGVNYERRGFTANERFITQAFVLRDYISGFIFPRPFTSALFNDDYPLVVGGGRYALAIIIWASYCAVISLALFRLWRYSCLVSFGLLIYFSGHILESTFIGLELYFEHRNYFPFLGLVIALVFVCWRCFFIERYKHISALIILMFVSVNCYTLWVRVGIWGNPVRAAILWQSIKPESSRANGHLAVVMSRLGEYDHAVNFLNKSYEIEKSPFILLNILNLSCKAGLSIPDVGLRAGDFLDAKYVNKAFSIMSEIVLRSRYKPCTGMELPWAESIVDAILSNPNYTSKGQKKTYLYLKGYILLHTNRVNEGITFYEQSFDQSPDGGALLMQSSNLAELGYCNAALKNLKRFDEVGPNSSFRESLRQKISPFSEEVSYMEESIKNGCVEGKVAQKSSAL
jgi:tetratricopeptide (TPR) repeat protein